MAKADVKHTKPLEWNEFKDKPAVDALPKIYELAIASSKRSREWYWSAISMKRWSSICSRWLSYLLGVAGVAAPLLAALLGTAESRLFWTQTGVVSLALAGLVQLGDRVFGFSSGWMRYVTTVTAMERLLAQFELDWAAYFLSKPGGAVTDADVPALFTLAKTFENETRRQQAEETSNWVTEFNSGMSALNEMIKFQKEAADKAEEAAHAENQAREQRDTKGAIQLTIKQKDPTREVAIQLGTREADKFRGVSWTATNVAPGVHDLRVSAGGFDERRAVKVEPGSIASLEVSLPD